MKPTSADTHDAYAALRLHEFRLFSLGRNLSGLGDAMQSVAVGWELYARTGKPLTLGGVGLVQALPIFLFALFAGHVADSFPRRRVAVIAQLAFCLCSLALANFSQHHAGIPFFYACLFCAASARAFGNPARSAFLPQLVPNALLGNAISWDTSLRRIAVVSGAAVGGWLLGLTNHPNSVYLANALLGFISALLLLLIKERPVPPSGKEPVTWKTLVAGITYIRRTDIVLATITLDMFAVLLGGATTLLPVFAIDILHVGPEKLGWLRAAPSVGALIMALSLAHFPPFRRPGQVILWVVVGFGIATIVFGLSHSLPLSLAALFFVGALDMVSVVVRQTLLQVLTPDEMRGRVNAVNSVFISTSNEIGGLESGVVAQFFSPVISVVSGGIGAILVAMTTAVVWPSMRD